jgi:hypothetical protein
MINVNGFTDTLGLGLGTSGNYASNALNAANTWMAWSFVPNQNDTLNTVRVRFNTNGGTPGANCQVTVYPDNNGVPDYTNNGGNGLGQVTVTPTSATWQTISGFTVSVTRGTLYWVVVKNTNGTPATNNFNLQYNSAVAATGMSRYTGFASNTQAWGFTHKRTTDGGSTWTGGVASPQPVRYGFSSGEYTGGPMLTQITTTASVGLDIHTKRACGARFTVPSNLRVNIIGVMIQARKTGTPTGNLIVNAYKNIGSGIPTVVGADRASFAIPQANIMTTTDGWVPMLFTSGLAAVGGDVLDFALRQTVDNSNSSNYYMPTEYTCDTDTPSLGLFGDWNPKLIKTTDDSTTAFSEGAGAVFGMALIVQSGTPFNAPTGGTGGTRLVNGGLVGR